MNAVDAAFQKLAKSKFRSRFRLSESDRKYISDKGIETIRSPSLTLRGCRFPMGRDARHAAGMPLRGLHSHAPRPSESAQRRQADADARTPRVQGATRLRLLLPRLPVKWWKVPKETAIPPERQSRIVDFLMAWIERQLNG